MPHPARRTVLSLLGVGLLTACGGAPPVLAPTGVDGLQIPTPSPRPGDFVDTIDNPWLAYEPGITWTYDVTANDAERVVVNIEPGEARQGVPTTALVSTAYDGADRRLWVVRDLLAQDRDGNVWWCGREVSGRPPAGMESSEANDGFGLWMPRALRLGDGFVVRPGQEIANVAETGVAVKTWMADFEGAVELRVDVSGRSESRAYVEGVGLVARSGGLWGDWSLRARAR
ncbi:MAG: hypothetical protein V9G04_15110 [Nocardioides sp.]|jgi:hypothetical protein